MEPIWAELQFSLFFQFLASFLYYLQVRIIQLALNIIFYTFKKKISNSIKQIVLKWTQWVTEVEDIILYIIKVGLRSRGCAMWLHQIAEILINFQILRINHIIYNKSWAQTPWLRHVSSPNCRNFNRFLKNKYNFFFLSFFPIISKLIKILI